MCLKENVEAAEAAAKHVKGLGIKADNKLTDRLAAAGGVETMIGQGLVRSDAASDAVRMARVETKLELEQADWEVRMGQREGPATPAEALLVKLRTRWGVTLGSKAGNCDEQARGALLYLFDNYNKVRPLHLMTFSAKGYDHVWVGVGLKDTWNKVDKKGSHNLREWGPDAVWCDPWQGDGVAFSVADFIKGKVRNLDVKFKCNTPELVEAGVPISLARFD